MTEPRTASGNPPSWTPPPGTRLILHLGLGAFHRAHQAVYLQRLRDAGIVDWVLAGGNIRPDAQELMRALGSQHGAYTLETVTPSGEHAYQRIESIAHVVPWSEQLDELVALAAEPATAVVSFTVTEAGYYLDQHGRLDTANPELRADLDGRSRRTIYGAVAALCAQRMRAGGGALTLLNCDNLRHNGDRFRAGLLEFVRLRGDEPLAAWLQARTTCPNAMVDRITPRPGPGLGQRVLAATGREDAAPVMAESFLQWVIEDRFAGARPPLERVGVQLVESVQPYEEAKIRVLNASHSCIAWAGSLLGYETIDQGTANPSIRAMAHAYVSDCVIPCLRHQQDPYPVDLGAYRDTVLDRFGNAFLRDTNRRVAMDGYSKVPGFIAPTVRECLEHGIDPRPALVLPALFFEFLGEWAAGRLRDPYDDQAMDASHVRALLAGADAARAFACERALWGSAAGDPRLVAAFEQALGQVRAWRAAQ